MRHVIPLLGALLLATPAFAIPVTYVGTVHDGSSGKSVVGARVTVDPPVVTDPLEVPLVTDENGQVRVVRQVGSLSPTPLVRVSIETDGRFAPVLIYLPATLLECGGCDPDFPCPVSPCPPLVYGWSAHLVPIPPPFAAAAVCGGAMPAVR